MHEAAERTLAELQQVTDAALANLSQEDLLSELLTRITAIVGSDTAAILVLDEDRDILVARAAKGIEEEVRRGVRLPLGRGFAGRVAAEGRPIRIPDVDHADILNPLLRERGIKSLLGVPLKVEGRVIGVLHVGTLTRRDFTDADVQLLQLVADRAAAAVALARSVEERWLATALQRALLPPIMPALPFTDLGARYLPAAIGTRLGGDWYDVLELPDGRLGIVVGDVVGRGVAAASLMAQARTAVRAYAFEGHDPAGVAAGLNQLLLRSERPRSATMVYLAYDEAAGEIEAVSAGHLPPVLRHADGSAELVELPAAAPLGVSAVARHASTRFALGEGATLLLYTDGLVERRTEPISSGLERLRAAVQDGPAAALALCDYALAAVEHDDDDDVALLALHAQPLPAVLELELPAETGTLTVLRRQIARWATRHGLPASATYDLTLATSEAAANAIEHAYGPGGGVYEVHGRVDGDQIVVEVCDRGTWRPERRSERGRGVMLMGALVDEADVGPRDGGGTMVRLAKGVGR